MIYDNIKGDQDECQNTDWFFNDPGNIRRDVLFKSGKTEKHPTSQLKPDRLRVTENCSLVVKKVRDEDVGLYTGRQQGQDSQAYLSVVTSEYLHHSFL